ncbi:MAG: PAS domain-containing protein [Ignavibacteria bacterium]|jgi:iron only hydrogenase large subunit-like protein|nr:PAS domain-containing protein [Ignavibacteria bacterium]
MDTSIIQSDYIYTKPAKCRDCYSCLKSCPVKAIKIKDGQAYIIDERCIHCNICAQNCAQKAIVYKNDKDKFYALQRSGKKLAISIAPSFSSICARWEIERFPSALRRLGASFVSTTSLAAYKVAKDTMQIVKDNPNKSYVASLCPTVINYIEKYRPELIDYLMPIANPYIVHSRWIRQRFGEDISIVHIDSCIANKMEILRPEFVGLLDVVLSYAELREIFDEQEVSLQTCEESQFDEDAGGAGRMYQLVGGLSATIGDCVSLLETKRLPISGFMDINNALEYVKLSSGVLVEPLFCYKGCINGPGMHVKNNIFERQKEIIEYINSHTSEKSEIDPLDNIDTSRTFCKTNVLQRSEYTSEQISKVLAKTGNPNPETRPNCFSCGYHACSDQAIAVLNDMAELEMCIPYMRYYAEEQSKCILNSSPNGIVTIDNKYRIKSMNPTFRTMFRTTDSVIGKHISAIIDSEPFENLLTNNLERYESTVRFDKFGIVCFEIIYRLPEDDSLVGMFVNITKNISDEEHLDKLRHKTLEQATELLAQQTIMATSIAKIIGENTAYSESLLENLMKFTQHDIVHNDPTNKINDWMM